MDEEKVQRRTMAYRGIIAVRLFLYRAFQRIYRICAVHAVVPVFPEYRNHIYEDEGGNLC